MSARWQPVHLAVAEQARRRPNKVAILDGRPFTYRELELAAGDAATRLREVGVTPSEPVAVCLPRSFEAVAGFLGVLGAGAAYLPLDPHGPRERLLMAVGDARPRFAFAHPDSMETLERAGCRVLPPPAVVASNRATRPASARGVAYVIYTSGSSGRPKGVLVGHEALAASVASLTRVFAVSESDRVLQFAALVWDTAGEEIYPALTTGATLVVDRDAHSGSFPRFLRLLDRASITVLDLPTGFWEELTAFLLGADEALPPALRLVAVGGEPVRRETVDAWSRSRAGGVRLVNTYGTTETVLVTHATDLAAGDDDEIAPIGVALPHVREALRGSVDEAPAELWIGGPALAYGYLGRGGATAERLAPDPATRGGRLYRTGDLVRRRRDGRLSFVGRADRQVKVHGVRLELSEVEATLRRHDDVRRVAAAAYRGGSGRTAVGACVESGAGDALVDDLMQLARESLPAPVLPLRLDVVDALPLLPSGKVDYEMVRGRLAAGRALVRR